MTIVKAKTVWLDGEWLEWNDAQVPILTHSLHYGFGVFEGTRAYRQTGGGTAIFRLDDHLRRLRESAHILRIDLDWKAEPLRAASIELVERNGLEACYLRHLAFIGDGVMGLHPGDNPVRLAIIAWPWGAYLGEEGLESGIRCMVSSYVRQFPNAALMKAKAIGNYTNSILAKREATRRGFDEAILLDTQGFVAEGSGENLFIVRDGQLKTPPSTAILKGVTRDTVLRLAERNGITCERRYFTRDELYVADEVFLTGTAAEITPVREVDDRMVGDGRPGPVTRLIQEQFFSTVRGEIPDLASWLTPVGALVQASGLRA